MLLSAWSPRLWFGWLNSNNQAFSQCRLTGLSDPKTAHKQMSEKPARTGYFTCTKLNTWHQCFHHEPFPLQIILLPSMAPQQHWNSKGLWDLWTWGLQCPSICQASWGLPKQPKMLHPKQLWGELASLCPSTQQLGHLLTLGDTAVHFEGSFLCFPLIHSFHTQLPRTY